MSDLQKQFSYRGTMILFLHLDDLQKISWTSSGAFLMVLSTVRQPEGKDSSQFVSAAQPTTAKHEKFRK